MDWVAYKLALHELYWITPGYSSDSKVALLMDEFVRNARIFVMPRTIYHEIDNNLLACSFHKLQQKEQVILRIKLLVTNYFGPMLSGLCDNENK